MALLESFIWFVISFIVSAIIIYIVTKIFGEKEGFGTAALAALIGSVIYAIAHYFLGAGFLVAVIAGIAWLVALGSLNGMGWLKSFVVAVIVWIVATLISLFLPTLTGPL